MAFFARKSNFTNFEIVGKAIKKVHVQIYVFSEYSHIFVGAHISTRRQQ